ncbi:transcriptional activator [Streptococcus pneumoniae]|nr:helix-turn-helix transcriptional regulator [Streptococcus pneumoniae]CIS71857.1 transcriptional activator [Streptococcus pneumoniae]
MNTLAEKFRLKRKELGLSQQTLAEGICEQSQISKIERGHFIPSADLLFKLSQRLEVPLDYFFNEQIEIKSNLSNFKQLSARLLDDRNYEDLEYIYRIEIERSTFLTLEDRTYLEWIKAIIDFYQYDSKCEAISSLENILLKVSSNTLIYLKALNTLSNFYSLVGREQEYEANYSHLMELYQTKNFEHQEFLFGYIRVRYNYSHYLVSKEKYNEAIQEALETIELCKQRQTSYQLAPLLILVGNAGAKFLDKEQVDSPNKLLQKEFVNKVRLVKLREGISFPPQTFCSNSHNDLKYH